jgi:hypothetical protein
MSRRQKIDMKSAFKALQVNQSLKLSKEGPALRAPSLELAHPEVPRNEAPPGEVTENEVAVTELTQTKVSKPEKAQIDVAQTEFPPSGATRIEVAQIEATQNESSLNEVPQSESTRDEPTPNEEPRNEAPHSKQARTEIPEIEEPHYEPTATGGGGGYFKLSHSVFSAPVLQKLPGDCFRLYLWMSSRPRTRHRLKKPQNAKGSRSNRPCRNRLQKWKSLVCFAPRLRSARPGRFPS